MQVNHTSIMNIPIGHYRSCEQVVDEVFTTYEKKGRCIAVSANPEMLLEAESDTALASALLNADVIFADGVGVVWAVKRKSGTGLTRLPGCEVWERLMQQSAAKAARVFLVGAKPAVLAQTESKLFQDFALQLVGSEDGYFADEQALIERIRAVNPDVVTVAMGSPRQHQFIQACADAGIDAIFMGVGGTYDVYSGHVRRAPALWQKLSLEWLYRLLSQPSRLSRQLNLVTFLRRILTGRL